ncbi:MAG TPA: NnrS family protein, partial [Magnetospirillum sp.]|nr:NnrS family protein [Magnetospirillum sp.]
AGVALLAAAGIHLLRLSRWHGLRTLSNPILWVLHLGYLWLGIGLALLGAASFTEVLPFSAAVHALTAGCVGTMVLGVMSRAALGHAGRPLQVSKATVAAYGLLSAGTVLRVLAPLVPEAQMGLTHAGGTLWALAWLLFVVVYFPIVTRPRADGRPG